MTRTPQPKLLPVEAAATICGVSPHTVLEWVERDAVPYVTSGSGVVKLPLHGLLRATAGLYTLDVEFREADDIAEGLEHDAERPAVVESVASAATKALDVATAAPPVDAARERVRALRAYAQA